MPDTGGFQVAIKREIDLTEQMELPLQIIYVVSGKARIRVSNRKYRMGLEDLILINGMESFDLKTENNGILCILSIDYDLISRMTSGTMAVMSLNSMEISGLPYEDIREIFRELVYFEVMGNEKIRCRKMSLLYKLLDILFLHCTQWGLGSPDKDASELTETERLAMILAYINAHFRDSMSLRDLANSMFTSTSTLSRFFKKQTGHYFAEYLNRVRLAHASTEITDTGRNITRIAIDCGFSSASSFSRLFHEVYGMTPQEYRRNQMENTEKREKEDLELRKLLSERLEQIRPRVSRAVPDRKIVISALEGEAFINPWSSILNMGSLSALTRANVQMHMLNMAKDLHMRYVKIWSVFAKDLRISDGRTKGAYNYSLVDTVLDVIVENQLSVYMDFGSRLDVIIGSSDKILFSEEVGIHFVSREIWEDLFESFINHLLNRYGQETIRYWIFDFCEDPTFRGKGQYYDDPEYDFRNVFRFAFRTLRRLVPGARTGGPTGIPNNRKKKIESFLRNCVQDGCIPDFVSILLLPYQPDETGGTFSRSPDPDFEKAQLRLMKQMIGQVTGKDIPVYVSDWNLSVSNRNILNDSCMRGAYLCSRADGIMEYAKICSLWVASDWVSNFYDTRMILSGGGGLITRDSIRKPAYYAQQFLGELTGTVLYRSSDMIVTMKNPESFRIVCANRVSFNIGYFLKEEEEINRDNMDAVVVSRGPVSWTLEIEGLEEGNEFMIKTRSVSRNYGSIQDEWMRFGCEERLFREDIRYLREICVPHLGMTRAVVEKGRLTHQISLDSQEFQLIHIFRKK